MPYDVDMNFTADIMQTLYQYSTEKILTDFKIRAGNKTAHCHSAVLSAKSTYFKSVCSSGMQEATLGRSISTDEDGATLDTVVRYIYLGRSNITVRNVEKIVLAADFLYHEEMKKECENVMLHNLDVSKLLSYHKLSQKADLSILKTACLRLAKEKFTEVAHSQWFLSLTIDEAVGYLCDDDLNVSAEDDVLLAICRWMENSSKSSTVTEDHIDVLFPCVRLKFCKRSTLETLSKDKAIMGPLRLKIFEFMQHEHYGEGAARKSYSTAHSASAASDELSRASVPGTDSKEKLPLPTKSAPKVRAKSPSKTTSPPAKAPAASPPKTKEEVVVVGGRKTGLKRHENIVLLDKDPKDSYLFPCQQLLGMCYKGYPHCQWRRY